MRKSFVLVLALALVAAFMPAAGAVTGSGTARFVHGVPGVDVDVYVDGAIFATAVEPMTVTAPAVVAEGDRTFDVYTTGDDPMVDTPLLTVVATVDSGADVMVVAHLDEGGASAIFAEANIPVALELSTSVTKVVHAADAPELSVEETVNGFIDGATDPGFVLTSGTSGSTQFSVGGTNTLEFRDSGTTTLVFGPEDVEISGTGYNVVVLVGAAADTSLQLLTFTIEGLHEASLWTAELSGAAEVPEVETDNVGRVGLAWVSADTVSYTITVQPGAGMEVSAAHIHLAPVGANGPVAVTLLTDAAPTPDGGRVIQGEFGEGDVAADPSVGFDGNFSTLLRWMNSGDAYVNVHTVATPSGEIRGQIAPLDIPMEPATFPDTATSVHLQSIEALAAAGIALGKVDGTFGVNDPVSRGQLATFIARTLGLAEVASGTFPDTSGSVHEGNINAVAALGIVNGRADGTFGPNDAVTRAQAAAMMRRTLDLGDVPDGFMHPFDDVTPGSTFEDDITLMWLLGVMNGCTETSFCPNGALSRGQMASVISRAFGWAGMTGQV